MVLGATCPLGANKGARCPGCGEQGLTAAGDRSSPSGAGSSRAPALRPKMPRPLQPLSLLVLLVLTATAQGQAGRCPRDPLYHCAWGGGQAPPKASDQLLGDLSSGTSLSQCSNSNFWGQSRKIWRHPPAAPVLPTALGVGELCWGWLPWYPRDSGKEAQ